MKSKTIEYVVMVITGLYLLNLTFGIDIIPDNLPVIGNLDEVIATLVFLQSYQQSKGKK